MIREVARHDAGRIREVFEWSLRDLLLAYLERLRTAARRNYEIELLVWSALAPHQRRKTDPPKLPRILRS
jgi:hypothetical protein